MHLRRLCLLLVLSLSSFLIVCSVASIDVAAETVPSGGRFLTTQEALQFIGSSIPVIYYDGSGYSQTTATYDGVVTCENEASENPVGYVLSADGVSSTQYLHYTIPAVGANNNNSYVTFNLQPTYSLFDTSMVYTCFALSYSISGLASYQSPQANFYIGGSIHHYENQSLQNAGSSARARLVFGSGTQIKNCTYVPISFTSQSTFSAYAVDCSFYGNGGSGIRHFYIMIPYVSNNASGGSGTFTEQQTSAGPPVNTGVTVDVNVDMEETNGLLESIWEGITGIGDTILHLFVPTSAQMEDFRQDLADLLDDNFAGITQSAGILDDVKDCILDAEPVTELQFPAISVPNTQFTLAAQTVNLVPIPSLLEYIKLGFDILATCLFINLIRLKFDEIIHGKVVIERDEVGVS